MTYEAFKSICKSLDGKGLLLPDIAKDDCYPGTDVKMMYLSIEGRRHFALCSEEIAREYYDCNDFFSVRRREIIVEHVTDNTGDAVFFARHPENAMIIPNKYDGLFPDPMEMSKEVIRAFAEHDDEMLADVIREYLSRICEEAHIWFVHYDGQDKLLPGLAMSIVAQYHPMDKKGHLDKALRLAFNYLARTYMASDNLACLYLLFVLVFSRTPARQMISDDPLVHYQFMLYCLEHSYDRSSQCFRFNKEELVLPYLQDTKRVHYMFDKCKERHIELNDDVDRLCRDILRRFASEIHYSAIEL